jgi:hypothetical protein
MANRSIQAKVERSAKESRELYAYDYLKYDAPKITSAELTELCRGVKVTRVAKTGWQSRTFGKRAGTCERRLWIGKPPRI